MRYTEGDAVANITRAALGQIDLPGLSREVRRTLDREMRDIEKDWRNGKPIQRKMALGLLPMVWREMYGLDLDQKPPSEPMVLAESEYPGYKKFANVAALDLRQALSHVKERDMSSAQLAATSQRAVTGSILATLYPLWDYMKASTLSDPNVFSVNDSLIEKLMNTDVGNVVPDDVRLPFPGIYISIPHGSKILESRNQLTGFHEISLIGIGEGLSKGKRAMFVVMWGEPHSHGSSPGDDHVYSFEFSLPDGGSRSLTELFEADASEARIGLETENRRPERDVLRFYGESFDLFDAAALLRRLVINFCLYLNSPNPDIEPTRSGQGKWGETELTRPKRTKVRVSKKRSGKPKMGRAKEWDVGRNVAKLVRRSMTTDILVRGHFRNQPFGVGRAKRRVIWIEPHIRLPTDPDHSHGHEYDVKPNAR